MAYLEARLSFKGLCQVSRLHLPLRSTKEQDDTKIAARGKTGSSLIDVSLFPFPGGSGKLVGRKSLFHRSDDDWQHIRPKSMLGHPRKRRTISMKEVDGDVSNVGYYNKPSVCVLLCLCRSFIGNKNRRNRPRSIYQCSSMVPRLSGQNCKLFQVSFVPQFPKET